MRAPRLCNPPALQLSPEGFMWPAINNGCLLGLSELFDEYPDLTRHDLFLYSSKCKGNYFFAYRRALVVIFLYKVCDIGAGEAAERRAGSKSDWLWGNFTDASVNFLQRSWSNLTEPLEQCSG
ncbi:MAG: hypothetical protein II491_03265, partial [Prevotella sp.]|nr:hypothetical protein [Prevotella sp.]